MSSPDPPMDDVDLCDALDEEVGPVALLAGFRTLDPAMARVGGLLNPPVALEDDVEDVVGFDVEEVDDAAGPKQHCQYCLQKIGLVTNVWRVRQLLAAWGAHSP